MDNIIDRDFLGHDNLFITKTITNVYLRNLLRLIINIIEMYSNDAFNVERNKLRFGDNMSKEIKQKTLELLRQYRGCTSLCFSDLGRTNSIEMQIKCTTDQSVFHHPYRMAPYKKKL